MTGSNHFQIKNANGSPAYPVKTSKMPQVFQKRFRKRAIQQKNIRWPVLHWKSTVCTEDIKVRERKRLSPQRLLQKLRVDLCRAKTQSVRSEEHTSELQSRFDLV